jgi:hypothetical protein
VALSFSPFFASSCTCMHSHSRDSGAILSRPSVWSMICSPFADRAISLRPHNIDRQLIAGYHAVHCRCGALWHNETFADSSTRLHEAKGCHDSLASQDAENIETCRLELASRIFTSTPVRPHLQFEGLFLDSLSMRRSVKQSSIRCASYIH